MVGALKTAGIGPSACTGIKLSGGLCDCTAPGELAGGLPEGATEGREER
jgi:hypothetical protein